MVNKGIIRFNCRSTNWNSGKQKTYIGQIECFLVYVPTIERIYLIDIKIAPTTSMYLRIGATKNNNKKLPKY